MSKAGPGPCSLNRRRCRRRLAAYGVSSAGSPGSEAAGRAVLRVVPGVARPLTQTLANVTVVEFADPQPHRPVHAFGGRQRCGGGVFSHAIDDSPPGPQTVAPKLGRAPTPHLSDRNRTTPAVRYLQDPFCAVPFAGRNWLGSWCTPGCKGCRVGRSRSPRRTRRALSTPAHVSDGLQPP